MSLVELLDTYKDFLDSPIAEAELRHSRDDVTLGRYMNRRYDGSVSRVLIRRSVWYSNQVQRTSGDA